MAIRFFCSLVCIVLIAFVSVSGATKDGAEKCDTSWCKDSFMRGIELEKAFVATDGKSDAQTHARLLKATESYQEDTLPLVFHYCVKCMAEDFDTATAMLFFQMLISYESSANEELSYALAVLYFHNADLVRSILPRFSVKEREYLIGALNWGWLNATDLNQGWYNAVDEVRSAKQDSLDNVLRVLNKMYCPGCSSQEEK